jgi:hypothetical protein
MFGCTLRVLVWGLALAQSLSAPPCRSRYPQTAKRLPPSLRLDSPQRATRKGHNTKEVHSHDFGNNHESLEVARRLTSDNLLVMWDRWVVPNSRAARHFSMARSLKSVCISMPIRS